MTHYDANGAQVVCTSTKAEYDAAQTLEPVHFVGHEQTGWVSE